MSLEKGERSQGRERELGLEHCEQFESEKVWELNWNKVFKYSLLTIYGLISWTPLNCELGILFN